MGVSEDIMLERLEQICDDLYLLDKTRERSLAITKLQECIMWLKKGRE